MTTLDDHVPLPPDEQPPETAAVDTPAVTAKPKRTTRKKKDAAAKAEPAEKTLAKVLLESFKFLALAQKDKGPAYGTHIRMAHGYLTAFDSILAAGVYTGFSIDAVPHTQRMIAALERCGEHVSLTKMENSIRVQSGRLSLSVPCIPADDFPDVQPDAMIGSANNAWIDGFKTLIPIIKESNDKLYKTCVMIDDQQMTATDSFIFLQHYNGINTPPGKQMLVPRTSAQAFIKAGKTIRSFGWRTESLTLWFDDGSWMKTQLYRENYPDISAVVNQFNREAKLYPVPEYLVEGVATLIPFCTNRIAIDYEGLKADDAKSSYALENVVPAPFVREFNPVQLKLALSHAQTLDMRSEERMYFAGANIRGVVALMKPVGSSSGVTAPSDEFPDDDIPF